MVAVVVVPGLGDTYRLLGDKSARPVRRLCGVGGLHGRLLLRELNGRHFRLLSEVERKEIETIQLRIPLIAKRKNQKEMLQCCVVCWLGKNVGQEDSLACMR